MIPRYQHYFITHQLNNILSQSHYLNLNLILIIALALCSYVILIFLSLRIAWDSASTRSIKVRAKRQPKMHPWLSTIHRCTTIRCRSAPLSLICQKRCNRCSLGLGLQPILAKIGHWRCWISIKCFHSTCAYCMRKTKELKACGWWQLE